MNPADIPHFFHRIRRESQKIIQVGILIDGFDLNKISLIYPYLEIEDGKISKTVFSVNQAGKVLPDLENKANKWIGFQDKDALKVAEIVYKNKIDALIALNDTEFIREILSYHAAPVQIAAGNLTDLKNSADNKNIPYTELILNGKTQLEKSVKSAVFASFDYLLSLKNTAPSPEKLRAYWEIFTVIAFTTNVNKLALLDYILLAKPTESKIINFIAIVLFHENAENIRYGIDFLPENSLAKKFLTLELKYREKNWAELEALARDIARLTPTNGQEEFIISSAIYRLSDADKAAGRFMEAAAKRLETVAKTPAAMPGLKYQRYSNYIFLLHYAGASPKEIFEASKGYAKLFTDIVRFSHTKRFKTAGDKLRIGYISPDFRHHVVANFARVFFEGKNPDRFETFAYILNAEDAYTDLIKQNADFYRNLQGIEIDAAAKLIYEDNIDILVDLSGHTKDNALPILAYKPAPIQISGVGYFSTTGLTEVDYFLADNYLAPNSEEEFFVEKLLKLPHSHLCYTPIMSAPEKNKNKNKFIVFGSMNSADKINENVWKTWGKILQKVPNSKLFLKTLSYNDAKRIESDKRRLEKYNIDPNRVIFESGSKDYLQKYNEIDIALDTFPYPGGGTTCDALMMNTPVVTLSGNSCHERFGKSILYNIGLEELVANSVEEYINIAVNLANDLPRLNKFHSEIYERMKNSAVMNQKLYMKDLENAYEKIYEEWLNSE